MIARITLVFEKQISEEDKPYYEEIVSEKDGQAIAEEFGEDPVKSDIEYYTVDSVDNRPTPR